MSFLQTFSLIFATIALFLYGLRSFSNEVKTLGSGQFQSLLAKLTKYNFVGFVLGVILTAAIQSSSAVSSITIALVDAGVIEFANSLALMLGANVGTTSTAWLVTFNVGEVAPFFIMLGTLVSIIPAKIQLAGKSLFYFGLILFALELISQAIEPLKTNPSIISFLALADNHFIGVLMGIVVTTLVQSSSVTTGLSILLTQQGVLTTEGAIAIIIGSNVGTSSTAVIASLQLNKWAKLSAIANLIFNLFGVILFFPFIGTLHKLVTLITDELGFQIAFAHLIFNLAISIITFPFLRKIGLWLEKQAT